MSIEFLRAQLPDYARDLSTNLALLADDATLDKAAHWGCFIASAHAVGEPLTLRAVEDAAKAGGASPDAIDAARSAAAMMAMTNVYFRALHLMQAPEYKALPSRLRMNHGGHADAPPTHYDLWCVAVSAINGCGACLDSHEAALRRKGVQPAEVQVALRIAAVVAAVARTLSAEAALRPQNSQV
ncbi:MULTISPECIES: carboxymuconolactone decarboxylase family protein [unclassified Caulobacter]|jgi:alkyl hydroperoxide reductase subunit D|uniref:carboxymuconolactone decarboxylase family protein n=1 Tax=unclassified Caulobacter TaxID=2648921 RepID=UPI0007860160|nr:MULTISPECIES: carboxymuconolactone decarboxylase family protein [unclassified Caulobacter]AZS23216.1 alkyl hydroperoxide reductase [Caulobacter sp. FWC26]